jgi:peptide/nickel transport system substrate-binding protein
MGMPVKSFALLLALPAFLGFDRQWRIQGEELQVTNGLSGTRGGRLRATQRNEPRTLNPVAALDNVSREIIALMNADLLHIDRPSFQVVPALARDWRVSGDRTEFVLRLRSGLRFSDGHLFDADDVAFTFQVHLDERVRSPQRELLIIGGKPISVEKIDRHTVKFRLAQAHPAGERLFDGIAILPRHLLEEAYQSGELVKTWGPSTPASKIAGLGPFRLKDYRPGRQLVLERNPHYWKVDRRSNRLPYLDEIAFVFASSEDAQVLRFINREIDIIGGISADNFRSIEERDKRERYRLYDIGPGLDYTFLFFNQNDTAASRLAPIRWKQVWFRQVAFRKAVSEAIDRASIVRLVYKGRAAPLWAHVTEGNKEWVNRTIRPSPRSLERARAMLNNAGFSWNSENKLIDPLGKPVSFSILTNAGNLQRSQIATIVQDDLKALGMEVNVLSIEFRAMMDRIFNTHEYEAAIMTLASGDTDPNSEMNVWTIKGSTHLWNMGGFAPPEWELEIDKLMRQQLVELKHSERKQLYDQVQTLVAENLPVICLVSPNVLAAALDRVGNVSPSILRPYVLWNADELFVTTETGRL